MMPFLTQQYGNPHSKSHEYGWYSEKAVENARKQVADLIGADSKQIIFTSGATQSNNLALKGIAHFNKQKKRHIITVQTQHKCVLDSCRKLQEQGFQVTYLPIKPDGVLDLNQFQQAIRPDTVIASVMFVNNQIGVLQPIKQIGSICRKHKVYFHTDAAQGVGKLPINVNQMNVDLLSISGHKMYGPKGIGALYVRRKPRVRLVAQISGGGQERGFRSGTLPAPLIVGLGEAARVCNQELESDLRHVTKLGEKFISQINRKVPRIVLNGSREERYIGNINISFSYVEGESLIMGIKDIAVSSGSACTSASLEPSYVLRALGVSEDLAHTSLRIGIGRFTTEQQIDAAVQLIASKVEKLRDMSPLWEMVQDGVDLNKIQWSQPH